MTEKLDIKHKGPKVTFQYGGSAYLALTYAKMKGCSFSSKQLSKCLSGKFNSVDGATKALKVLEKNNCVQRLSVNDWVITKTGVDVVFDFAKARKEQVIVRGMG